MLWIKIIGRRDGRKDNPSILRAQRKKRHLAKGEKRCRGTGLAQEKKIFILDLQQILVERNLELGFRELAGSDLRTDALATEFSTLEAQYPRTEQNLISL